MATAKNAIEVFFEEKFRVQMPRHVIEPAKRKIDPILIEQVKRLLAIGGHHLQIHVWRQPSQSIEQWRNDGQRQPVGCADAVDSGRASRVEGCTLKEAIVDKRNGLAD